MLPIRIPMTISSTRVKVPMVVSGSGIVVGMNISATYGIMPVDTYDGETTVTPSDKEQALPTAGLFMKSDVIINPIPSNYGLIEWNGSTLTVS